MVKQPIERPVTLRQVIEKLDALVEKADAFLKFHGGIVTGPRLYTVEQVAEFLQVEKRTVVGMIKRGELAYLDVCTSSSGQKPRKRIREDDLMVFLESRRTNTIEKQRLHQEYLRRRRRRRKN